MILLDTNVVSEPLKASCDTSVLSWIDEQVIETLYLSTISLAELRFGIAVLPEGYTLFQPRAASFTIIRWTHPAFR
jgi:toxin FitB